MILKGRKRKSDVITIGVDSSTTSCGVAVFINGKLDATDNYKFVGTYDIDKLHAISVVFGKLFSDYKPEIVLLEEPINVRNARTAMGLNQVAGAIVSLAVMSGAHVGYVHNKTMKKIYNIVTKDDSVRVATRDFGVKEPISEHEADAILVVGTYMRLYGDL